MDPEKPDQTRIYKGSKFDVIWDNPPCPPTTNDATKTEGLRNTKSATTRNPSTEEKSNDTQTRPKSSDV